jgi:hypothetical protein
VGGGGRCKTGGRTPLAPPELPASALSETEGEGGGEGDLNQQGTPQNVIHIYPFHVSFPEPGEKKALCYSFSLFSRTGGKAREEILNKCRLPSFLPLSEAFPSLFFLYTLNTENEEYPTSPYFTPLYIHLHPP